MKAGKPNLTTHTLTPSPEVARSLEAALAEIDAARRSKGLDFTLRLTRAIDVLEGLRSTHPDDPRILRLLDMARTAVSPGDLGKDARRIAAAFQNLAHQAKLLEQALHAPGKVTAIEGAAVSAFDKRMMKAVVKLAEKPLAKNNTPAATILSLDGKIISLGINRSYFPLPNWRAHGEMEALVAMEQRIYRGMAQILDRHIQAGGQVDAATAALVQKLKAQGLEQDASFIDDAKSLRDGGFFGAAKIAEYAEKLKAFAQAGSFLRDEDGKLLKYHDEVLRDALAEGTVRRSDLADWATLERSLGAGAASKLTLYTSLEPCGMCLQCCTSQGHVGRIVYAAKDEAGGGISTMPGYAKIYFDLNRVPFELVGGLEAERAQAMYDHFFLNIYPKVKAKPVES